MKIYITLFLICFFLGTFAQSPGNIGATNLTAWFKPDALTLGNVTSWTTTLSSLGGVTVTDATAPFPQATNTPTGNISNYNTTLFFNNNTTTNLQSLQNTAAINLLQNNSTGAQGTFICAYYFPQVSGSSNNHMLLYNNSPHAIQFRNLGTTGRLAIGLSATNTANACRNWNESHLPTILSYKGNRSTSTSMTAFENDLIFPTSSASQSSGPTGLYMGNFPGNSNAAYNGYIHEYIFYNTDLSNADLTKVHTYLGIKYGATLDNTGGGTQGDYVATDGTIIWDASVYPIYHNDVIGIGRDDNQALLQKQSHSFSDDFRLYLSTLAANNVSNTGSFNNDLSYVTMGHLLDGCGTTASNTEAPAGIATRVAEEWKVQNTNFTQTFNWDVKIDTCNNPGFAVGPVDLNNLRLLVDNDGDFTNATSYGPGAGLTFSYNNGYITVNGISNIHLPEDSIRYFTLAYNTITVSFSGSTTSTCAGEPVAVTVNINDAGGPINVTYNNGTSNVTLTNISNGYVFNVSPTTTTSYTIQGYKSFLNCCGGAGSGVFTINVSPYPTVIANASINPICIGQSTQLSGTGATTYTWNGGIINGSNQSPTANTTYTVIGQNAAGCADTASVTVVVNSVPTVTASSTATTICQGTQITLTGGGANTYSWTNGVTNNVPFTPTSSMTYTVNGTNSSNCSSTASIAITVNPTPNILAVASDSSLCQGDPVTLYGTGGATYTWSGGITNNISFVPTTSGTYTVTGTNSNGCVNTDDVSIVINPVPTVTAVATPATICQGDSSQLLASGADLYVWSSGTVNGDSVSPPITTTYSVVGATLAGCVNTAVISLNVNQNPPVIANANPSIVCQGDQTSIYGSGAISYTWSNGVINNVPFTPTVTNTYTVIGTDANNCSSTDDITITVVPSIFFSIGPDTTTCPQSPVILSGNGNFSSYLWSTGETTPIISVGTVGPVSLTVMDINGCEYSDNLVLFLADDCFPTYNVPNVFTPNGDNNNDYFFIDATNIASQSITIVNRWNNVMFSKTSPQPFWDGKTPEGTMAEDGVYFVSYTLKAENGETITGSGFLHLVGK